MAQQADFKVARSRVDHQGVFSAMVRVYRGAVETFRARETPSDNRNPDRLVSVTRYRRSLLVREGMVDAKQLEAMEQAVARAPEAESACCTERERATSAMRKASAVASIPDSISIA